MSPDYIQELVLIEISAMQRKILMDTNPDDRNREIAALFYEVENDNPDKSIEWLLQMTADRWSVIHGEDMDASDVVTALAEAYADD